MLVPCPPVTEPFPSPALYPFLAARVLTGEGDSPGSVQLSVTWPTAYDEFDRGPEGQGWRGKYKACAGAVREYSGEYNYVIVAQKLAPSS